MSEQHDPELDALVDALRGDVPSERDRDRVRRKLIAAGVAVSAGSALSGAVVAKASAASASVGSTGATGAGAGVVGAGLGAKLAALSLSAKISAGVVVLASASALSVYDAGERSSRSSARQPVTQAVVAAAPALAPTAHAAEEPAAIEPSVIVASAPAPIAAVAAPARLRAEAPRARVATTRSAPPAVDPVPDELTVPTPQAPESAPLPSALRAEAELLERALSALHAGELQAARQALRAHAERFPQGALRRERERAHQQLTLLAATRTDR
jgi:TolA-binding protein